VRSVLRRRLLASLVCLPAAAILAQEPSKAPPADQFFSGAIVEITADRITVSRNVLGKDSSTRTFLITQATRIEGKPRAKARVTVRFVSGEDGDRAIHIIVRSK
jgi:hypothetical protein